MNIQILDKLLTTPYRFKKLLHCYQLDDGCHPEHYGLEEVDWPKFREWYNAKPCPIKEVHHDTRYDGCDPYSFVVYGVTLADGEVRYIEEREFYSSYGDNGEPTYRWVVPKEKLVTVWEAP